MRKHVKRLLSFGLFTVLIFSGFFGFPAEKVPPAEVVQAAQQGICEFAKAESSPVRSPFKVSSKAEMENARLGYGFQVYTVSPVNLIKDSTLASMVTPTDLWRFVVTADGQPVSLITVARLEGRWRAVSMGGAGLAAEISQVMARWPAEKGFGHRFVRIYQARADFIEISGTGQTAGFVPLTASRMALHLEGKFDPAQILSPGEVHVSLRDIVSRAMKRDIQE